MKTDAVLLNTYKTQREITNNLRRAASQLRAEIESPEHSMVGNVGMYSADISVVLSGSNFILGGPRKWGVQVLVTDKGSVREVELIAVGDSFFSKMSYGSFGNAFFELRDSIKRRDAILGLLK